MVRLIESNYISWIPKSSFWQSKIIIRIVTFFLVFGIPSEDRQFSLPLPLSILHPHTNLVPLLLHRYLWLKSLAVLVWISDLCVSRFQLITLRYRGSTSRSYGWLRSGIAEVQWLAALKWKVAAFCFIKWHAPCRQYNSWVYHVGGVSCPASSPGGLWSINTGIYTTTVSPEVCIHERRVHRSNVLWPKSKNLLPWRISFLCCPFLSYTLVDFSPTSI